MARKLRCLTRTFSSKLKQYGYLGKHAGNSKAYDRHMKSKLIFAFLSATVFKRKSRVCFTNNIIIWLGFFIQNKNVFKSWCVRLWYFLITLKLYSGETQRLVRVREVYESHHIWDCQLSISWTLVTFPNENNSWNENSEQIPTLNSQRNLWISAMFVGNTHDASFYFNWIGKRCRWL